MYFKHCTKRKRFLDPIQVWLALWHFMYYGNCPNRISIVPICYSIVSTTPNVNPDARDRCTAVPRIKFIFFWVLQLFVGQFLSSNIQKYFHAIRWEHFILSLHGAQPMPVLLAPAHNFKLLSGMKLLGCGDSVSLNWPFSCIFEVKVSVRGGLAQMAAIFNNRNSSRAFEMHLVHHHILRVT